jgi:hypothetical protein
MGTTDHDELAENKQDPSRCGGPDDSRVAAGDQVSSPKKEEQTSRAGGPDDSRGKAS